MPVKHNKHLSQVLLLNGKIIVAFFSMMDKRNRGEAVLSESVDLDRRKTTLEYKGMAIVIKDFVVEFRDRKHGESTEIYFLRSK